MLPLGGAGAVTGRIDQEIIIIDLQAGTLIAWEPNWEALTAHFTPAETATSLGAGRSEERGVRSEE